MAFIVLSRDTKSDLDHIGALAPRAIQGSAPHGKMNCLGGNPKRQRRTFEMKPHVGRPDPKNPGDYAISA